MYSYYILASGHYGALEALEQEFERPLRVLPQSARTRNNSWNSQERGDYTADEVQERGITIACGEMAHGDTEYIDPTFGEFNVEYGIPRAGAELPIEVDGVVIGEIQPLRVNVYFQYPHYDGYEGVLPINRAVEEAVRMCVEGDLIERWDELRAAAAERALRTYVERTMNHQLAAQRNEVDLLTRNISAYNANIARDTRQLIQKQELLEALLTVQRNDGRATMLREWGRLQSHPRVASASFNRDGYLEITTTDDLRLTRSDTGESRWLGAFEIRINLDTFAIGLTNLNTPRGGRQHPHVPADGNPCFGGHQTQMYEILGRGEIYTVFELLLQYIESVNLRDSWGSFASYWFEVPDERPLEVAEAVAA